MAKRARKGLGRADSAQAEQIRMNWDQGPSFYANSVEVKTSLLDIKLRLMEVLDIRDKKTVVVRELARVFVSPQHAKLLAVTLVRSVQAYEKQFGKIPETPS